MNHVKITGTCKYSCRTIGYCLRTIVNIHVISKKRFIQPFPGVYRASYQGCGGGIVVPVTSLFSQCRLLLIQDVLFFSSLSLCMFNATLIKSDLGDYNICSDRSDQSTMY